MSREEIAQLLKQIKMFYPRFDAVEKVDGVFRINPETMDAWHRRLGYMSLDRALAILDSYMESEDNSKTPGIWLWMNNGKSATRRSDVDGTAWFDSKHGVVVWRPERDGTTYEIPVQWNERLGCLEDDEGRLWAEPEG